MADAEPVSWRSIRYGTPVTSSTGDVVATVREILGSDAEDIFHGVRALLSDGRREVLIPANDITSLSRDAVGTDLSPSDLASLTMYDEEATYHLASVGWLRKHVGWVRDSKRDEESG